MLAPAEIATPLRHILGRQANATVLLAEVTGVDVARRAVLLCTPGGAHRELTYDYLVLATGARHSYFSHHEFADHSHGLKSLPDALAIRDDILRAFEKAELTQRTADVRPGRGRADGGGDGRGDCRTAALHDAARLPAH
jgi:NADH dehydrogenase